MPYLVSNIPSIQCLVLKPFLTNFKENGFVEATLISVKSIARHGLMFEAFIHDQAAIYDKLPIEAIRFPEGQEHTEHFQGHYLEIWDNPSYYFTVIEKTFLQAGEVIVMMKDGRMIKGTYLFTIDFCHSNPNELNVDFSEDWSEHKSKNIIRLENGQLAAQPNNRIRVVDSSLSHPDSLEKPIYLKAAPNFRYRRENHGEWELGQTDNFNYEP